MHTRRVGAFLVGGWLLGTLLVWFLMSQNLMNVDRMLSTPPAPIAKELENMGQEVSRQLLRYQAVQHNRHTAETWEMIQFGIGGALLATSFLTAHRSRFIITATLMMLGIVSLMAFVLTPTMNSLGRAVDFLPAGAGTVERESIQFYLVWHRVLEILKSAIGVTIAARLLFDRYNWRDKLVPSAGKERRRRRMPAARTESQPETSGQQPAAEA